METHCDHGRREDRQDAFDVCAGSSFGSGRDGDHSGGQSLESAVGHTARFGCCVANDILDRRTPAVEFGEDRSGEDPSERRTENRGGAQRCPLEEGTAGDAQGAGRQHKIAPSQKDSGRTAAEQGRGSGRQFFRPLLVRWTRLPTLELETSDTLYATSIKLSVGTLDASAAGSEICSHRIPPGFEFFDSDEGTGFVFHTVQSADQPTSR
jgi:hypothetical protein